MSSIDELDLSTEFAHEVRAHLERVERHNEHVLDVVSRQLYEVVTGGGRVLTAGTGHSLGFVLETFYRAGGLACVEPLYHPGLLPLHGAAESTLLEHTSGLAAEMVAKAGPGPDDISFIASNSGINEVPVELAAALREAGTPVVAIMSVPHSTRAVARGTHKLGDLADQVLDTLVPYGDAAFHSGDARTAGLSSLTTVHLWNLLLVRLAVRASDDGKQLPLWTSSNVTGGQERNAELLASYRPRLRAL